MSRAYELAKKYYPALWGKKKLRQLVENGSLTPGQYEELTGEAWEDD